VVVERSILTEINEDVMLGHARRRPRHSSTVVNCIVNDALGPDFQKKFTTNLEKI